MPLIIQGWLCGVLIGGVVRIRRSILLLSCKLDDDVDV